MPGLKEIRKRIVSVKSTKQITKAMKMVAAAKFRKAQSRILEFRPYADKLYSAMANLAQSADANHPLLQVRPVKKVELVAITGDKGLCGAFNANIMKAVQKKVKELQASGVEVSITAIGKKAIDFLKRRNYPLRKTWTGLSGRVSYSDAQQVAKEIIEQYTNGAFDEVIIIYNEFKSAILQKVTFLKLLPMTPQSADETSKPTEQAAAIYEPSEQAIFEHLLPKNIETQFYRALLDSAAAEEAARMTAMENATKAANDMIDSLTLQYNKARQASITKELMDIVGGVEALKHN